MFLRRDEHFFVIIKESIKPDIYLTLEIVVGFLEES
jgi:hypothetical protein